jgi:hypothetical protein
MKPCPVCEEGLERENLLACPLCGWVEPAPADGDVDRFLPGVALGMGLVLLFWLASKVTM